MKTNTSHKLLPLFGSQFEVDRPPFLPSSELTAPIFWRSPLPLRAAIWQWVAIWYLSAPPGGPGLSHCARIAIMAYIVNLTTVLDDYAIIRTMPLNIIY